MRRRSGISRTALAGACLLALAACGASNPAAVDAGTHPVRCTVVAPTVCPTPAPRYADVVPVIQQSCVICHAGEPDGPWPLDDYPNVSDWRDDIRDDLLDCSMPPPDAGFVMSDADRMQILTWIRCGAPE